MRANAPQWGPSASPWAPSPSAYGSHAQPLGSMAMQGSAPQPWGATPQPGSPLHALWGSAPHGAVSATSALGALPNRQWSGLGGWLHRRALWASVGLPLVAASVAALIACISGDWMVWSISGGMLILGFAQLFRAAALLQRTCYGGSLRQFPSPRTATVSLLAVVLTAVATVMLAVGIGAEDFEESQSFGALVGVVALLHLSRRSTLQWPEFPREPMYRRFHSMMPEELFRVLILAFCCAIFAAWSDGVALRTYALASRFSAGALVLLCGTLQAEVLQNVTSLRLEQLPSAGELAEALAEPVAATGPGLGRWVAMACLGQAAETIGQRRVPGAWHPTDMGRGLPAIARPYAAEMFSRAAPVLSHSSTPAGPQAAASTPAADAGFSALGSAPGSAAQGGFAHPTGRIGVTPVGGNASWLVPLGGNASWGGTDGGFSTGLFALYLKSGLEILRELTVRLQCLVLSTNRRGVDALLPAQLGALGTSVIELLPLVRLSVIGLASWICLSREMDRAGVVQREEALRKVIYEFCGLFAAFERLWPLCGVVGLSEKNIRLLQDAQEEVRQRLEVLLGQFEEAGLRFIKLPTQYRRLILSLG